MRFTSYVLFSLVFFLAVFVGTATIGMQHYELALEEALRIALWVSVPGWVFFLITSALLLYHKMRSVLLESKKQKDLLALIDQIYAQARSFTLINPLDPINQTPNTTEAIQAMAQDTPILAPRKRLSQPYLELSRILSRFMLVPLPYTSKSGNATIDKLFSLYRNIAQGALADVRKFHLPSYNPFIAHNDKNYAHTSVKHALETFNNAQKSDEIRIHAFEYICATRQAKELQKILLSDACACLTKQHILTALVLCKELNITLALDHIATLCNNAAFQAHDYCALAQALQPLCVPNAWLEYIEHLASIDEQARAAYITVLLELEMLDVAERELKHYEKEEFLGLRAYITLKRLNKSYPLKAFAIS